ncbi:MAG: molybdenum cofactor guanylyltransferase [Roseburia sp.]
MEHALVILCGGNSVRMGTDKALLPFGDSCLIEYLVKEFSPYFSNIYLSVKRKGDYAHLNLKVTEISDIYPNAGPMSGIFSALSMIRENAAFFMSVDTPFLEPATGLALFDAIGDADICTLEEKEKTLDLPTGVYTKNIIMSVGKCLLLRQLTFQNLYARCHTKYIPYDAIPTQTPFEIQNFNMDTRSDYYHALQMLSCFEPAIVDLKKTSDSFK